MSGQERLGVGIAAGACGFLWLRECVLVRARTSWLVLNPSPEGRLVDRILATRGYETPEQREQFLFPDFEAHLHDPSLLPDMDAACERIFRALDGGERIVVFGDYDADGVTATVLLLDLFRALGAPCSAILPHRLRDGYGIKRAGVERALAQGAGLIITVDNGMSAHEALGFARQAGVDVIVTDHHLQGAGDRPPACAVVNPNRRDSEYPFPGIAGVGVAYKLAAAVAHQRMTPRQAERFLKWSLDLVAMGTVADVAPLVDENRVFVHYGLKVIAHARRPGVRALLAVSGTSQRRLAPEVIGFRLGPRINAAGRLDAADHALRLLRAQDPGEARPLAERLDAINRQRQTMLKEAVDQLLPTIDEDARLLAVRGSWHPGIIGLIAARLCERYHRPAVVMTDFDGSETLKGSARSPECFHITRALDRVAHLLAGHGGHSRAAGLSVPLEAVDELIAQLTAQAEEQLTEEDLVRSIVIDTPVREDELTLEQAEELLRLQPCGQGNPRPILAYEGARVEHARALTNGAHLKLLLGIGSRTIDGIGFGLGEWFPKLPKGATIDAAFHLDVNEWRGRRSPQLVLADIRLRAEEP